METESLSVEEYCRLCLEPNAPYLSLFDNRTAEMLESLTSIKVTHGDTTPNLTCFKCFVELKCAYETQQRLINTEALLEEKILNDAMAKNKVESHVDEMGISQIFIICVDDENTNITEAETEKGALNETDNLECPDDQNDTVFKCSSCPMECDTITKYKQHLTVHKKRHCLMCPKMIPADKLVEHNRTHESGFCEYCGAQLKHSGSLRKHVKLWHREPKITCEQCGDVLHNKRAFDVHVRRIHTKDPEFMCDYCGAKFFGLLQLKKHIKEKHSNEKPFNCNACTETFVTKWKLKMHELNKHSDVILFTCEFCGKGFKFKATMNLHKKSTHGWRPEEKFQCRTCNNWFPSRLALNVHTTHMHMK